MEEEKKGGDDGDTNEKNIYDLLRDKLGVTFDHGKPTFITRNNYEDEDKKTPSIMDEFDLEKEFKTYFSKCTNEKREIIKYFKSECLPFLIKQDYTEKENMIHDLFTPTMTHRDILAISDRIDLLISLLKHDSSIQFKDLQRRFHLTLQQLNKISEELPKLWQTPEFLSLYLSKLMPTQISFYQATKKSFNDIPINLALKCFEIAVQFVLDETKCQHQSFKCEILLNYLQFLLSNNVC